jgi:hypothetical protein
VAFYLFFTNNVADQPSGSGPCGFEKKLSPRGFVEDSFVLLSFLLSCDDDR